MPCAAAVWVTSVTALDYVGFGLPPGSPSLGELLDQGKRNLQAPWLGITGFLVTSILLSLLVFMGEWLRDPLDPRKTFQGASRFSISAISRLRSGKEARAILPS